MARRRGPPLHPQTQTHTSEDGAGLARRRRCSPRIRPQIHVSEEGAGMTCRRSPRLHSQTPTSEDGAGMACRRSPRLHSQTPTREDGAGMACRRSPRHHRRITRRRRRGTSPATPASLQDNEDMLWEILLRLPPQPSSLPRASAVCKRWRGLVTDPRFLRRFRAHHRKPPLLGVFESFDEIMLSWRRSLSNRHFLNGSFNRSFNRVTEFRSILEPPDEIPLQGIESSIHSGTDLFGCRHGRVLLMDRAHENVWVCDPITGEQHRFYTPSDFRRYVHLNVAVLCAATEQGHVHGSCHSSPFKVVVMSPCGEGDRPVACVYSSETGVWGNNISAMAQCGLGAANSGILVGNALYWSSKSVSTGAPPLNLKLTDDIIEFDLDRQSLAVIKGPADLNGSLVHQIIQTDGAVGLALFSEGRFKMWDRNVNPHGGATWLLQKTVELHTIIGLPTQIERSVAILGYDEDNGVILLYLAGTNYMVHLMPMESKELSESNCAYRCYPFTSFCAPAGGFDGAEMLPLV